jgi:hypothetical protein
MIIAVDPGPHTGIATWLFPDTSKAGAINPVNFAFETLDLREVNAPHLCLAQYLDRRIINRDTLVLERFEFQKEKAQQRPHINYDAAEYVGAVKLWHQQMSSQRRPELVTQSPAFAVGNEDSIFWTNEKLKHLGLYQLTKSEHERSALRHLLQYVSVTLNDKRFIYALKGM